MSTKDNDIDFDKFISHDETTNIGQCLVPECQTVFIGKKKIAIKRHYRIAHCVNIEEIDNTGQTIQIHNNDVRGEGNPAVLYSIKYLNQNPKHKSNDELQDTLDDKGYKTFLVADYVEYNKETNISKCLIKNCERPMSGRRTGNIKRHYHKVHNFVIVHDNQETICTINKELSEYYNNETFGDSRVEEEFEEDEEISDATEQPPVNFDKYVDYDTLINKSLCKVPGCKAYLVGMKPFSIKRHYGLVHNYDIESNGTKLFDKSNYSFINNGHSLNNSIIAVDDLLAYDIKSATLQCLFINCNHILEKHLPTIKKHYHEHHKIIIARDSCNIPQRLYRKRKHRDMQYPYETEFSTEDREFMYESESSCFIKNKLLSHDEQPNCSKRPNKNLTDYMKEMIPYSIKKGNISEHNNNCLKEMLEKPQKVESTREKSNNLEITLTKQTFFKLCLGLVIERDVSIKLFDDDKYFKRLLAPYEQLFDCNINGTVIEDLLYKANNIIVDNLREMLNNKIICLELNVINYENNYYVILNARFLEQEAVCNKVIGFLLINETKNTLPINECLSKFNIDEQQVYMKTIMAGKQDDEEIYKICDNLCKCNADIKTHPIYDLQTILRTFVQKYTEDIKKWQILANYKEEFNNLHEFEKHLDNLSETDIDLKPQLKKAKYFLKALQIYGNFRKKITKAQYVAGDFYRDCLCCELELQGEFTKNHNTYAGELYEELSASKNSLLESSEFIAALYLDARFNFLGSRLLSDANKSKGKLFLCDLWEKFSNYLQCANSCIDPIMDEDSYDDEYALLTQHINDTMPLKSVVCMQDKLNNCVPTKREPFSLDILKYWHCNRQFMEDIHELAKIVFTHSASHYVCEYLQTNFAVCHEDDSQKFNRFFIKFNQNIFDKNLQQIFENVK